MMASEMCFGPVYSPEAGRAACGAAGAWAPGVCADAMAPNEAIAASNATRNWVRILPSLEAVRLRQHRSPGAQTRLRHRASQAGTGKFTAPISELGRSHNPEK